MPTKRKWGVTFFYRRDSFLSNHHPAPFTLKGKTFHNVEQCYLYSKALVHRDFVMADAIYNTSDPAKIKQLDALMQKSEYSDWTNERAYNIMKAATYCKYAQNPHLLKQLLGTDGDLIVEASPNKLWGIGVDVLSQHLFDTRFWSGENLLGQVIAEVRVMLGGLPPPELSEVIESYEKYKKSA